MKFEQLDKTIENVLLSIDDPDVYFVRRIVCYASEDKPTHFKIESKEVKYMTLHDIQEFIESYEWALVRVRD